MENNKLLVKLLTDSIASMTLAMPLLEDMHGQIPPEIIELIDYLNKLTVKY